MRLGFRLSGLGRLDLAKSICRGRHLCLGIFLLLLLLPLPVATLAPAVLTSLLPDCVDLSSFSLVLVSAEVDALVEELAFVLLVLEVTASSAAVVATALPVAVWALDAVASSLLKRFFEERFDSLVVGLPPISIGQSPTLLKSLACLAIK